MSIKDKINYYKDSLNSFDDTMEKYKFLYLSIHVLTNKLTRSNVISDRVSLCSDEYTTTSQ